MPAYVATRSPAQRWQSLRSRCLLLEFAVVRRRSSEARILWTVSLNGRELDWCATFEAASVRVEARAIIAPTLEGWQTYCANASALRDVVRRRGR